MSIAQEVQNEENSFEQEIKAMEIVAKAIQPLRPDSQKRVLQWVSARFQVQSSVAEQIRAGGGRPVLKGSEFANDTAFSAGDVNQQSALYPDLATLFDTANPKTNNSKALVGGYWVQECQNNADFASQQINADLKNLGHGLTNVTDAFDALIAQKLVMQVRKSGSTKQARKKYRLTREGIKRVQQMLNGTDEI